MFNQIFKSCSIIWQQQKKPISFFLFITMMIIFFTYSQGNITEDSRRITQNVLQSLTEVERQSDEIIAFTPQINQLEDLVKSYNDLSKKITTTQDYVTKLEKSFNGDITQVQTIQLKQIPSTYISVLKIVNNNLAKSNQFYEVEIKSMPLWKDYIKINPQLNTDFDQLKISEIENSLSAGEKIMTTYDNRTSQLDLSVQNTFLDYTKSEKNKIENIKTKIKKSKEQNPDNQSNNEIQEQVINANIRSQIKELSQNELPVIPKFRQVESKEILNSKYLETKNQLLSEIKKFIDSSSKSESNT
jgi:hypothetical protein